MHLNHIKAESWAKELYPNRSFTLFPLAGDASFREYYRLNTENKTEIIMIAPPENEPLHSFIDIASILSKKNLKVPHIHHYDVTRGLALLEDFGDTLLLNVLNKTSAKAFYPQAIDLIIEMQHCSTQNLSSFDASFITKELELFQHWFLEEQLNIKLATEEQSLLTNQFQWLTEYIIKQPQVFIHRDFHSRNLMLCTSEQQNPFLGILDFQDAMKGPWAYDLVSLLKDCYIKWPRYQILRWVAYFYKQICKQQQNLSLNVLLKDFDLCGLQRHLKVLGIFSRLQVRDKKSAYLKHIPLVLNYVKDCLRSYQELKPLYYFILNKLPHTVLLSKLHRSVL